DGEAGDLLAVAAQGVGVEDVLEADEAVAAELRDLRFVQGVGKVDGGSHGRSPWGGWNGHGVSALAGRHPAPVSNRVSELSSTCRAASTSGQNHGRYSGPMSPAASQARAVCPSRTPCLAPASTPQPLASRQAAAAALALGGGGRVCTSAQAQDGLDRRDPAAGPGVSARWRSPAAPTGPAAPSARGGRRGHR